MYYIIGINSGGTVKKLAYENGAYYFTENLFEALRFNDEEECIDYIEENIPYKTLKKFEKKMVRKITILRIAEIKYERISYLSIKKEDDLK